MVIHPIKEGGKASILYLAWCVPSCLCSGPSCLCSGSETVKEFVNVS